MAGFALLFMIFPLAICVAMIVGLIVFLVACWNSMRAHESLAHSARRAVAEMRAHEQA